MKTGDKVRFLHRKEEGTIARVINEKSVEVEIENDFPITAQKEELILVDTPEEEPQKEKSPKKVKIKRHQHKQR